MLDRKKMKQSLQAPRLFTLPKSAGNATGSGLSLTLKSLSFILMEAVVLKSLLITLECFITAY